MDTRRAFIKKAAILSGAAGVQLTLPEAIIKALQINPEPGSTYLDAEHIVFLMQENRSFDHSFGCLQGVRGFNDPRAIQQANKNKIWAQSNKNGKSFLPFNLNIKDSNATWLGSLPHSWPDMTAARNNGWNDNWLEAKKPGRKDCADIPLTMGYYNRNDLPFYYELADAFTICDQHFCSSLTGTTPNRSFFWSGAIRQNKNADDKAHVYNSDINYSNEVNWKTLPEYLEEAGISWKVYQNEISIDTGFEGEEEDWLANFTDNPLEWFSQYYVRFSKNHLQHLRKMLIVLKNEITTLETELDKITDEKQINENKKNTLKKREQLAAYTKTLERYTDENYEKLSPVNKSLHKKAFSNNENDPQYRKLSEITYTEGTEERNIKVPAGDILFQLREDVTNGKLPAISWLVPPCNYSDHPGAPWYGAWYLSEVFEILTSNPEIWKKTIFIVNYDENDGYFDHFPPFVPPNPYIKNGGKASAGITTDYEFVHQQQQWLQQANNKKNEPTGPVGLGFRVPMLIASPWTRGGYVCSQVFDLTSPIQFIEHWAQEKLSKKIKVAAISEWRRTISGNLTSAFRKYNGQPIHFPDTLAFNKTITDIHKARFKSLPGGYKQLLPDDIEAINKGLFKWNPQEKGTRKSNALPYELYADKQVNLQQGVVEITFNCGNTNFGEVAAGSPFQVFNYSEYNNAIEPPRHYAVSAGDSITDSWKLNEFTNNNHYHLEVLGPNGFFRVFKGYKNEPAIVIAVKPQTVKGKFTGNLMVSFINKQQKLCTLAITDLAYGNKPVTITLLGAAQKSVVLPLSKSNNWYDFKITESENTGLYWQYAGRVETGTEGITDPQMG